MQLTRNIALLRGIEQSNVSPPCVQYFSRLLAQVRGTLAILGFYRTDDVIALVLVFQVVLMLPVP